MSTDGREKTYSELHQRIVGFITGLVFLVAVLAVGCGALWLVLKLIFKAASSH